MSLPVSRRRSSPTLHRCRSSTDRLPRSSRLGNASRTGLPSAVVFSWIDEDLVVRPFRIGPPGLLAGLNIRRPCHISLHAEAHCWKSLIKDLVLDHHRRRIPVPAFNGSPFLADQTTLPVLASSATSVVSAWCRKTLPSPYKPRFDCVRHITAITFGSVGSDSKGSCLVGQIGATPYRETAHARTSRCRRSE